MLEIGLTCLSCITGAGRRVRAIASNKLPPTNAEARNCACSVPWSVGGSGKGRRESKSISQLIFMYFP